MNTGTEASWLSFAWPLDIGVPLFALVCCLWRRRLASSWARRLFAALLLGLVCVPTIFAPHGPGAVFPTVFLSPFFLVDPYACLLFVALPILVTTIIVFGVWSLGLRLFKRRGLRAATGSR